MAHQPPWDLHKGLPLRNRLGTDQDAANLGDLGGEFHYASLNLPENLAAATPNGFGETVPVPVDAILDFSATYISESAPPVPSASSAAIPRPSGDLHYHFECKVRGWLESPGKRDLRLECLDEEEEAILAKIARSCRLNLRLEHSPYSNIKSSELRVAIFSRPSTGDRQAGIVAPRRQDHTSHPPAVEYARRLSHVPPAISPGWDYLFPDAPAPEYQPPDPWVLAQPFPPAVGVDHWGSNILEPPMLWADLNEYPGPSFVVQADPQLLPSLATTPAADLLAPYQTQFEGLSHIGVSVEGTDARPRTQIALQHPSRNLASPRTLGRNQIGSSLRKFFGACRSRDIDAAGGTCWPCRLARKRCDCDTPCRRCSGSKDAGIMCRRGPVWDSTLLPFLCPGRASQQTQPHQKQPQQRCSSPGAHSVLPEDLWPAARAISEARSRRKSDEKRMLRSGSRPGDGRNLRILVNVIAIEDKDLQGYFHTWETQLSYDFSYAGLITKIVWELIDNRQAARLIGSDAVDDLVGLLEAASRCEVRFPGRDAKNRLVFSSMSCLWYCLETLRLGCANLLRSNAHSSCSPKMCISPGIGGLNTEIPQYLDSLTGALLGKKRNDDSHWLLTFYSLCIQAYVRRALMGLEESWQSVCPGGENPTGVPSSANYLHTAVPLFSRISSQNRGKLEDEILQAQPPRSEYLGLASLGDLFNQRLSNPTSGAEGWDKWREEGIDRYLRRIFAINDAVPARADYSNDGYDSDRTVTSVPTTVANNRRNRDSKDSTGSSRVPRKKVHAATSFESIVTQVPPTLSELTATQTSIVAPTPKSAACSTFSHSSQYSMTSISDGTSFTGFSNTSSVSLSSSDDGSVFTYCNL
ncbi:hypothetical protein B0T24DRAFT_618358 [Lasiosphaeria ovina]|uniref:Uncharacterized protein n=1 Tax=Lasiosphaeria ovina TaxID=92902 RepID=A0AAE0NB92_9PEZI|nr:hypothetical protein B0T24DRAFT_618358 [Lasiosphaeria ovina]